jgi:uncharacterized protein YdiU (UPF0061 family)
MATPFHTPKVINIYCGAMATSIQAPVASPGMKMNHQGGKVLGQMRRRQEAVLEEVNKEYIRCGHFDHVEVRQRQ